MTRHPRDTLTGARPATSRRRRRRLLPVLGLVVAAALTGCGGDDADPAAAEPGGGGGADDRDRQILAFYECLRENGLDVADPEQQGAISLEGVDTDDPTQMAVVEQCGEDHLAAGGGLIGGGDGERADVEAVVDFADCLREHGIEDMPDPGPDGHLALPDGLDPQSAEFQGALEQCRDRLSGGGIRIGRPGGGGLQR